MAIRIREFPEESFMQDDKLSISVTDNGRRSGRRVRTLLLLAVLLVAAGCGYWWFDSLDKPDPPSDTRRTLSLPSTQGEQSVPGGSSVSSVDGTAGRNPEDETARNLSESPAGQGTEGLSPQVATEVTEEQPSAVAQVEADRDTTQGTGQSTSQAETATPAASPDVPGTEIRFALAGQSAAPAASEGRQDDAVVSSLFTGDLARWMVQGYHPGKSGKGYLAVGISAANVHYGTTLKGFNWRGDDLYAARKDILNYVFSSGMLNGLYRLYIDRFLQNLDTAATARGLTSVQMQNMYELYARQFTGLAGVLNGLAAIPNLPVKLNELTKLAHSVAEADTRYGMFAVARERAKMAGDATRARALSADVNRAMREYQHAVQARERGARDLVRAVKRTTDARILDDSAILFVASWIGRRFAWHENMQTVRTAAELSADIARRLTDKARP